MGTRHPNLIKIGKLIRDLREASGLSQEEFALRSHMGRTYIGRVERGEQNISIQNLIQIAFTLKVEVKDLVPPIKKLIVPPHSKKYQI